MITEEFKIVPKIIEAETLDEFLTMFEVNSDDVIVTDRFVITSERKKKLPCRVVYQDEYGRGEPTVERVGSVVGAIPRGNGRIIGIGGGSALDIAKIAAVDIPKDEDCRSYITDIFAKKKTFSRKRGLILIPTTCGTGSEVTNISVAMSEALQVKIGLADEALYADAAVLIPEMLNGIPYKVLISSSMDALIHGVESWLSPKATVMSRMFSESAVKSILGAYITLRDKGADAAPALYRDLLLASNQAGIAFSNAGCGQIHAMSYPLGAAYHIPHGEANHQLFLAIMEYYQEKNESGTPDNAFDRLCGIFDSCFHTVGQGWEQFKSLIKVTMVRIPLHEYGMTEKECDSFAHTVKETQERLTKNAYISLSVDDMRMIYEKIL